MNNNKQFNKQNKNNYRRVNMNNTFNRTNSEVSIKWIGKEMIKMENELKSKKLVINRPQYNKYLRAIKFFNRNDGKIVYYARPEELNGYLTAEFICFDLNGKDVQEFNQIIQQASAIGMDASTNGKLSISITIPNIYIVDYPNWK